MICVGHGDGQSQDCAGLAGGSSTQIILFDPPGFQSKGLPQAASVCFGGPALGPQNQAGFEEFCVNFSNELLHSTS